MKKSKIFRGLTITLEGAGQVMFQQNAWTGLLFLAGIFWGAYESGTPEVAWGAVAGLVAATLAGMITEPDSKDGSQGLWGFNGILVGCAFPTFLADTWLMWATLVFCSMLSTWVRTGFNNLLASAKINSLTFPFVFILWIFLLASGNIAGIEPVSVSKQEFAEPAAMVLDTSFGSLVEYWLKGVSQVFLINSWVTGIFFLAGLALSNCRAALWAGAGSAIALALALLFKAGASDIAEGMFGFSPVLTGIAIGCTFYKPNLRSAAWSVTAIIATVFVQAGMDMFLDRFGLPVLTGPFCVTTWLFLLPSYKFNKLQT